MNIDKWLDTLKSARSSIGLAKDEIGVISSWIRKNVVANDVLPNRLPSDLAGALDTLYAALCSSDSYMGEIEEALLNSIQLCLSGRLLSREQYYLLMTMGIMNIPNKSTHLSGFDDYEVYCFFVHESENQHGYIEPGLKAPNSSKSIRIGRWSPEEILWKDLRPDQKCFFQDNLPEIAKRFKS